MRNALTGAWLAGLCGLGFGDLAFAQATVGRPATAVPPGDRPPAAVVAAPGPLTDRPADERAVRELSAAFVRSYDAGDARGLAALFTDDAEIVDENGGRLRGRPAIENVLAAMFRQRPGAAFTFAPASLRFFGPDVAQEEGESSVRIDGEPPSLRQYTALFVRQGAGWRYSSLREEHDPALTPHQRLEELAWLVGDWTDESPDSVVHASCRWTPDGHFLLRDFTVRVQGQPVMTVNERIGWDPSVRQIRSWVFDSEGGHSSGLWSRDGNRWVIKSSGVLPDGRIATATHTLTRVGPTSAQWASLERTAGDRVVPDQAEYLMVRQPPRPGAR